MKEKIIPTVVAAAMLFSAVSCGSVAKDQSGAVAASSSAEKYASWLNARLDGSDATEIVVGTDEDADSLGIDVSGLRDEGYTIRKVDGHAVIVGKTTDGLDRGVRYYANNLADVENASYTYAEGYAVKSLTIAGNDISEYTIVLPEESDECSDYAAESLQKYIKRACGADLPAVAFGTEVAGRRIVLERVMRDSADYAEFGDESFLIDVASDGTLTIKGGYYRGIMYGSFELLESYIGYRFLYDNLTYRSAYQDDPRGNLDYLYEADAIDIPAGTHDMQSPSFAYRSAFFNGSSAEYLAHRKTNDTDEQAKGGLAGFTMAKYGDFGVGVKACHGVDLNVLGAGYDFDGYDPASNKQPCYSDEDFIEYSLERYKAKIDAKIAAGGIIGKNITTIDVSQRDNDSFCQCRNCLKLNRTDGGYVGSVLTYTNRIAEEIEAAYGPEIRVAMLAYWGTSTPPKVTRPRDNVTISYCFYNDILKNVCYSHPIDGKSCTGTKGTVVKPVSNAGYAAELEGWCEMTGKDQIIVWYYPGTWSHSGMVSPLAAHFREDMAYFASFEQIYGVFTCPAGAAITAGDLAMPYLIERLMWNADMSEEEYNDMILEYFSILLGEESAGYIVEHMNAVEDLALDYCWSTMAWTDPSERMSIEQNIESFPYFVELYDRAIAAAESEFAEYYIEALSCTMLHTGLVYVHDSWYANGDSESRAKYAELFETFRERGNRVNYPYSENNVAAEGKVYDIEKNPSYLLNYNNSTDGPEEWWLTYTRQQEIAATAEVTE